MQTYPLFAIITGKPVLVVGGGAVGERKVQDLTAAGGRVTVVSREFTPKLKEMAARGEITAICGDFTPEQVTGMALVVGATDDPAVNVAVSRAAQAANIWVNIVDAPELCTFIVPAQVKRGELTIAISTGGASPALARRLRETLEHAVGPEYGPYLDLLRAVREGLLAVRRGHPDNTSLFLKLVDSPLKEAVARGDLEAATDILTGVVGPWLSREELRELAARTLAETR
jgi:precorrin-2 dehydrogenase/sirohydrochlorin ferrochelatase